MKTGMQKDVRDDTESHNWTVPIGEGGHIQLAVDRRYDDTLVARIRLFNDYDHGDDMVVYNLNESEFEAFMEDVYDFELAYRNMKAGKSAEGL